MNIFKGIVKIIVIIAWVVIIIAGLLYLWFSGYFSFLFESLGITPKVSSGASNPAYDTVRLVDLDHLQKGLVEFLKQSPERVFPRNTQEYLTIPKFYPLLGGQLPKDPLTKIDYCYTVDSTGQSYTITTILQSSMYKEQSNIEIPQTCTFPEGAKVMCSPQKKCYQVYQ